MDAAQDRRVGTVLPGGYVLQECIGGGGMGQVYRAEQSALGRSVAVKIVHPYLLSDDTVSGRFINEARLASRLNHPNSVAVIDFGRTEDGLLYLVMEHLRGRDLARVLVEDWPLSFERIIDILRQLLDVLAEAHQLGIVHLDLKPDNIVLEPTRRGGDFVKVVDFGLARMLAGSSGTSDPSMTISGTPDYMAPEQCRGERPDARSDLYAVGVILFLLLTGRLPFEAEAPTQVLLNHLTQPPPDPREVNPGRRIPDGIVEVLQRALEKEPDNRFQTAVDFSTALAEARFQITTPMRMPTLPPPDAPAKQCTVCGDPVPTVQKFCGSCGARMPWADRLPSLRPPGIAVFGSPGILPFPLVERDGELAALSEELDACTDSLRLCRLEGETGSGKTRLLEEFDMVASTLDHSVFKVRAEPWPLSPAWGAIRKLIPALIGQELASLLANPPPDTRVAGGLELLFGDAPKPSSMPRADAAHAMRWAFEAARNASRRPVVVLVDDLDQLDGASRNALSDALLLADLPGVMVVVAHGPGYAPPWLEDKPRYEVRPLSKDASRSLLASHGMADRLPHLPEHALPLYLEHCVRFEQDGGTAPPPRLGDLIAARFARLGAGPRRVLQAVGVLGPLATTEQIQHMVGPGTDAAALAQELGAAGILSRTTGCFCFSHPFLRRIARAATPATVLRELHAKAALLAPASLPLEIRSFHLEHAGDVFAALLSLERIGAQARDHDDLESALEAFRRGFELARRSAGDPSLDDPMHTVALFGLKLGETLSQLGRHGEADGILGESLAFASTVEQRARITFAQASVARLRGKTRRALELAREAIDLVYDRDTHLAATFEQEARWWKA
jgi:serine/threonine-protein kinase